MCKEERPLSTVRFISDALSLNPTESTPTPETTQIENERPREEIEVFESIYLPALTKNGLSMTDHDREEMSFRGLRPISEDDLATARGIQARRPSNQPSPSELRSAQRLLNMFLGWPFDPTQPTSDVGLPSQDLGNQAFEIPTLEDTFAPDIQRPEVEDANVSEANAAAGMPFSTFVFDDEIFPARRREDPRLEQVMGALQRPGSGSTMFEGDRYQDLRLVRYR